LSPLEALQSATINNAKLFKHDDVLGSIEPGKLADLVILDGDPLADIRNTAKTYAVFKNGIPIVMNGELLDHRPIRDPRKVLDGPFPPPSWLVPQIQA
jgi:adenine deaminase